MSTKQNTMPWFTDYNCKQDKRWPTFSAVIAQAEAAFLSCQYQELIAIIKEALEQGGDELEQTIVLRCLLNEALCELSRYEEAYSVITSYEESNELPNKLQAELSLRIGATCN